MAPWSHLELTKQERWACEDSHAQNQVCSTGTSHRQDRSARGSPRETPQELLKIVDIDVLNRLQAVSLLFKTPWGTTQ